MTDITQQIRLIEIMRESFDNNQREYVLTKYSPSQLAELFRDIHETLLAVKLWQVKTDVCLCDDCNQPIKPGQRVHFAAGNNGKVLVRREETVCERCTNLREMKANNHHTQL